jgi:hypothetical protein
MVRVVISRFFPSSTDTFSYLVTVYASFSCLMSLSSPRQCAGKSRDGILLAPPVRGGDCGDLSALWGHCKFAVSFALFRVDDDFILGRKRTK